MISADDYVLQLLVQHDVINDQAVDLARKEASESADDTEIDSKALDLLVERGYVDHGRIVEILAEEFGMERISLSEVSPDQEVLREISSKDARKYCIFPLQSDEREFQVAISDPLDVDVTDNLATRLRKDVIPFLAPAQEIRNMIERYYGKEDTSEVAGLLSELRDPETGESMEDTEIEGLDLAAESEAEGPIIRYVFALITEAIKRRASDIHLEPLEKRFRVRYRIDGVLHEMDSPPKRLQPSIISRLKIMANVSIAEKRVPQDGRINVKTAGKIIDLRVSSLPTAFGESIVMRILDKEGLKLGLPELGFFSDDQATFERIIGMADGVFLVTGPTGSGKSTTLYSALNYINKPDRKIITVEDPVEYEMAGINQVQVRREIGMTFAAALRAMLRQAPNIIMVGEIRDKETAEIAINASLTGHMVFSTLHTNDAPSAVTRLVDIGVKPFLVSAALRAVLAQRLVRRICAQCKEAYTPDRKELDAIGVRDEDLDTANFMKGKGCPSCNGTGYRGRFGVFEMFFVNDEMSQLIYEGRTLVDIRRKARDLGMRSMREDGIRKILAGMTTPEEVIRATVVST